MTTRARSFLFLRARPVVAACGLLAGAAAGCRSVRTDEALAMLDVSAAADVPSFTTARFSVAGRAEIRPHEIPYNGRGTLKFGYYLPGPTGTLRITGQALSASCLVGVGTAEIDVQLGRVSGPVTLVIARLEEIDSFCLAPPDAGAIGDAPNDVASDSASDVANGAASDVANDAASDVASDSANDVASDSANDVANDSANDVANDSANDARDAADAPTADAKPDVTAPPPPACMIATKPCPGAAACCSGLTCGTTTLGRVCCGNFGMTCTRSNGEDCCGQLECVNGGCCLPATYPCTGSSCCAGLVCGNTTLGRVCCGNSGAPCTRGDGADCCGALRCVGNVCRP